MPGALLAAQCVLLRDRDVLRLRGGLPHRWKAQQTQGHAEKGVKIVRFETEIYDSAKKLPEKIGKAVIDIAVNQSPAQRRQRDTAERKNQQPPAHPAGCKVSEEAGWG